MLADEGCPVGIVARTKADVEAAATAIGHRGGTAIGVPADITSRDGVQLAVERVRDELGDPLIVIGQTKYIRPGDFADITDPAPLRESFESYTISQFFLLHAVLPAMKDAGWGRYVHIGSATAKEPRAASITSLPTPPARRRWGCSRQWQTNMPATASRSTPSRRDGSRRRTPSTT
ncbi:SDR family NAD(P)-dependent oxidoreductase [uncultured Mycobacterium sp.]|uniref:SDR family NAD(P)-dependent oxidoreductase n=1 Tax=uncultured Mycobacterium sp. TaxID=171292 RepID=UPI0035CC8ACD